MSIKSLSTLTNVFRVLAIVFGVITLVVVAINLIWINVPSSISAQWFAFFGLFSLGLAMALNKKKERPE
ncbi:hypothetical protein DH09_05260 [Bacillaceae bacterium JMAK1]|nr:hypothetical protein DH09_05260 [Bacillaceae bacterium JMAK1]